MANVNGKKNILLIVESPAKAKTIEKYIGEGYTVEASMGHLIDLPKSRIAVDVDNNFEPEYITVRGKAKILKMLVQKSRKIEKVLLASDPDREGEAISYHIKNALLKKNPDLEFERIIFNEITPKAIRESVLHPRQIDDKKVNAQKARRVLDRLVGYNLSPLLWSKVKNGLSAGRVQSVALRLICERENEVEAFIPEEYWTLSALLDKGKKSFEAQLVKYKDSKPELKSKKDVELISDTLKDLLFAVSDIKNTEKISKPKAPYTTSKLQQAAANRLGFTSRKTMQIAQQLYEGINIGSSRIGLITYMRTDSTRIAQSALDEVRAFIGKNYPDELPETQISYTVSQKAQDAHEAIRPTYVDNTPDSIKDSLTKDQHKLYSIIWEQFVSSQMNPMKSISRSIDFSAGEAVFRASDTKIIEPGYHSVLKMLSPKDKRKALPTFKIGEELECEGFTPEQHFTSGPARFTDASIVKMLEEQGIGRPSTYAPIISVLLDRYYVVRKNKQLVPTQLGRIINDILSSSFPDVLNVGFTAEMEKKLDLVEEDKEEWVKILKDFFFPFKETVDKVMNSLESIKGVMDEPTEFSCEKCGRPMVKKLGRFGFFLACSGFPECKSTKPVPLGDCPRESCNGKIIARRRAGGKGREFYGCTNYPECEFFTQYKPINQKCPKCGQSLVEKEDKKRGSYKSCITPECTYLHVDEEALRENAVEEVQENGAE
ncbi:MAG: type I DNA topoisomerase [Spirochaetales bacterium]|nr:type I DNA topoisomerase [Spirochaetales bacterium]